MSTGRQVEYPLYGVRLRAHRRALFYVWNIKFFVLLLMVLQGFVQMSLHLGNPLPDRMGIFLTIFLTFAAFKFVIADKVPKVSYMTALDKCAHHDV